MIGRKRSLLLWLCLILLSLALIVQTGHAQTKKPTKAPTKRPTKRPTKEPTKRPTKRPTAKPTKKPTRAPTRRPTTRAPTRRPAPSQRPTLSPTSLETEAPTNEPTTQPTAPPTNDDPTSSPTTEVPSAAPTTAAPTTAAPSTAPTTADMSTTTVFGVQYGARFVVSPLRPNSCTSLSALEPYVPTTSFVYSLLQSLGAVSVYVDCTGEFTKLYKNANCDGIPYSVVGFQPPNLFPRLCGEGETTCAFACSNPYRRNILSGSFFASDSSDCNNIAGSVASFPTGLLHQCFRDEPTVAGSSQMFVLNPNKRNAIDLQTYIGTECAGEPVQQVEAFDVNICLSSSTGGRTVTKAGGFVWQGQAVPVTPVPTRAPTTIPDSANRVFVVTRSAYLTQGGSLARRAGFTVWQRRPDVCVPVPGGDGAYLYDCTRGVLTNYASGGLASCQGRYSRTTYSEETLVGGAQVIPATNLTEFVQCESVRRADLAAVTSYQTSDCSGNPTVQGVSPTAIGICNPLTEKSSTKPDISGKYLITYTYPNGDCSGPGTLSPEVRTLGGQCNTQGATSSSKVYNGFCDWDLPCPPPALLFPTAAPTMNRSTTNAPTPPPTPVGGAAATVGATTGVLAGALILGLAAIM